jgi:hypothetical protein
MKATIAIASASMLFTGCATVMNDTNQPVKVEAVSPDGTSVSGADCTLVNDRGVVLVKSGGTAQVHRSSADLAITCVQPDQVDAKARAVSRANAGLWGNVLIGGGIGAVIDHTRGTAYTYPTWVQLVFGKALLFDRSSEKDGQPTPATEAAVASK